MLQKKIDSKEISVVVQGAIDKVETKKCLTSIRKYLPKAEIILSTWECSDISSLEDLYDILVLNKDPGAVKFESTGVYHNINRQIVSTKNGINQANRKFILKIRSDLILTKIDFLDYYFKYPSRHDRYQLFKNKVIVPAIFSRYKYRLNSIETPFQVSDWWYFGLREDIKMFFDSINTVQEPNYSLYFEKNNMKNYFGKKYPVQYTPEQYFCLSAFHAKFPEIYMENMMTYTDVLVNISKLAVVNNFIILEFAQHGIYTNKHYVSKDEKILGEAYITLYNNIVYDSEYKRLLDSDFSFNRDLLIALKSKCNQKFLKFYKHINSIIYNQYNIKKTIKILLLSVPFSLLAFLCEYIKTLLKREF